MRLAQKVDLRFDPKSKPSQYAKPIYQAKIPKFDQKLSLLLTDLVCDCPKIVTQVESKITLTLTELDGTCPKNRVVSLGPKSGARPKLNFGQAPFLGRPPMSEIDHVFGRN